MEDYPDLHQFQSTQHEKSFPNDNQKIVSTRHFPRFPRIGCLRAAVRRLVVWIRWYPGHLNEYGRPNCGFSKLKSNLGFLRSQPPTGQCATPYLEHRIDCSRASLLFAIRFGQILPLIELKIIIQDWNGIWGCWCHVIGPLRIPSIAIPNVWGIHAPARSYHARVQIRFLRRICVVHAY